MFWSSVLVVNFMIILFCMVITDNVFTICFRRLKLGSYGSELSVLLKQKTWRSPRVNILTNSRIFNKLRLTYVVHMQIFYISFPVSRDKSASDICKNVYCLTIEIWTVPKKITNQWLSTLNDHTLKISIIMQVVSLSVYKTFFSVKSPYSLFPQGFLPHRGMV